MYDAGKVTIGLIVFVGIVTSGFWYNVIAGQGTHKPELQIPTEESQCVAEKEYMRTSHMALLNEWRDSVVRKGERLHVAPNGTSHNKSLSNTCMSCHSSKEQFCNECHNYAGVQVSCWNCHVLPEESE